jgi:membrane-associated protein
MEILDFLLHIDIYLENIISLFGNWSYFILFAVIFAETGLIIAPFLPGDSLLFVAGMLAGKGILNIIALYFVLLLAAILGDTINYWVGYYFGPKVFSKENSRFFNKVYLEKTSKFFEKYGKKTIVVARFMPILRTFAPFVAGMGQMQYKTFFGYNIIGAFIWVTSLTFAGFYFGGLQFVKDNFEYAVFLIIAISVLPLITEYIKYKKNSKSN